MRYKMYVHAFAYMGLNVHLCVAIPDANLPILIHLKCITRIAQGINSMLWHKNLVSFMIISSIKLKNHNLWMNLVGNEFSDSVGKRNSSISYQIRSVKIIILYLEKKSIIIMFPFCKTYIFFSFLMNKKSIANILNINNKSASSMQKNFS